MTPSMPTICLLLLSSGGRIRSSLQEDREHRLGRQEHHHPEARKPKVDNGKLTAVIDVSSDVDQQPNSAGEYTGAYLTKPGMPSGWAICGAFRTDAWTTEFSQANLFQLDGKDGTRWGYIKMKAYSSYTKCCSLLGNNVYISVSTAIVWFPSLGPESVCPSI